jgi:uncharacterized membrane protein YadS
MARQTQHEKDVATFSLKRVFPWFVLVFLVVVIFNSAGLFSETISSYIATAGKFCMVMALGAIGLKTDAKTLLRSGHKPMLLGLIISTAVVVVSYLVQFLLHQL